MTLAARPARPRRWWVLGAWLLWALMMLSLAVAAWLNPLLIQAGKPDTADDIP